MKKWIQAIRLSVLTASVLPAIFGAVYAFYAEGVFKVGLFFLTLLGIAVVHTGANLINDYFDFRSGADLQNEEFLPTVTGGSRVIVDGSFTARKVLAVSIACLAIGVLIGVYLAFVAGPAVWALISFGLITSIVYTTPKFNLINMKLGEVVIGLDFGVLTILGAYYVQTGSFSLNALLVSLPVGILIAAILLINEFQDYKSDKQVGKMTTVVRIGRKAGARLLAAMLVLLLALIVVNILVGSLPVWSLLTLLSVPLFLKAIRQASQFFDQPEHLPLANLGVIMGQLVLMLALILSILLESSLYFLIGLAPVLLLTFKAMKETRVI